MGTKVTLVIVALAVGIAVGRTTAPEPTPSCPTEDSCTAQYTNHHWIITEVTP